MDPSKSRRLLYVLLGLVFLATAASQGTYTADVIRDLQQRYPVKPGLLGDPWPTIRGLDPTARSAGLKVGDRVEAIDGRPARGWTDLALEVRSRHRGDELPVAVQRDGGRAVPG